MKFKLEINGVIEDIADCEMLRLPKREVTKYACGQEVLSKIQT